MHTLVLVNSNRMHILYAYEIAMHENSRRIKEVESVRNQFGKDDRKAIEKRL